MLDLDNDYSTLSNGGGFIDPTYIVPRPLPGRNRSISARKCCQAGSCPGSRWLVLSSGTGRLFGINAASNLDCSKRAPGSRREHMISGAR